MKKLILFLSVIFIISGCSMKSYNKTIVYPDYSIKKTYNSISTDGVWCGFEGCINYYRPHCINCLGSGCCSGIYMNDEFWW